MLHRILTIGILAAAALFAQGGGGGGRGGGGGGRGGDMAPMGNFGPVNKLDRISDMLKLTKDQKKDLKQTFDDAQKEAIPIHDQIVKARLSLGEAIAAGKPAEEISQASTAEAALETQMTMIELKAFAKFATGLEPDQKQRVGMLFGMMRGMFNHKNWNAE